MNVLGGLISVIQVTVAFCGKLHPESTDGTGFNTFMEFDMACEKILEDIDAFGTLKKRCKDSFVVCLPAAEG